MSRLLVLDRQLNQKYITEIDNMVDNIDIISPQKTIFDIQINKNIKVGDLVVLSSHNVTEYIGVISELRHEYNTQIHSYPLISLTDVECVLGNISGDVVAWIIKALNDNFINVGDNLFRIKLDIVNKTQKEVSLISDLVGNNLFDALIDIFKKTGVYLKFDMSYTEVGRPDKLICEIHNSNEEDEINIRDDNPLIMEEPIYEFNYDGVNKVIFTPSGEGDSFALYLKKDGTVTADSDDADRIEPVVQQVEQYDSTLSEQDRNKYIANKGYEILGGNLSQFSIKLKMKSNDGYPVTPFRKINLITKSETYNTYITAIKDYNGQYYDLVLGVIRNTLTDKLKAVSKSKSSTTSISSSGGGSSVIVEDTLTSSSTTNALSANQGRLLKQFTDKAITEVYVNDETGIFTFNRQDGTFFQVDTLLEKVVTNFDYDGETQSIVLTLEDGTIKQIPMTAFIDDYTGVDGEIITITISNDNKISATIKNGTIGKEKLTTELQNVIENKADKSELPKIDTVLDINSKNAVENRVVTRALNDKLQSNQGSENAGKLMQVNEDGSVGYVEPIDSTTTIVDNLITPSKTSALSANMGRYLDKIKANNYYSFNKAYSMTEPSEYMFNIDGYKLNEFNPNYCVGEDGIVVCATYTNISTNEIAVVVLKFKDGLRNGYEIVGEFNTGGITFDYGGYNIPNISFDTIHNQYLLVCRKSNSITEKQFGVYASQDLYEWRELDITELGSYPPLKPYFNYRTNYWIMPFRNKLKVATEDLIFDELDISEQISQYGNIIYSDYINGDNVFIQSKGNEFYISKANINLLDTSVYFETYKMQIDLGNNNQVNHMIFNNGVYIIALSSGTTNSSIYTSGSLTGQFENIGTTNTLDGLVNINGVVIGHSSVIKPSATVINLIYTYGNDIKEIQLPDYPLNMNSCLFVIPSEEKIILYGKYGQNYLANFYIPSIPNYDGAGLPIGLIFPSAIPQESASFHLLDGTTIAQDGVYADFVALLKQLVSSGYKLTCTQSEFDADVTRTGNCGKFVVDDSAKTVRLPKITKYIQGLSNLTDLGTSLEAGLPNIEGSVTFNVASQLKDSRYYTGSFTPSQKSTNYRTSETTNSVSSYTDELLFDASKSNEIYGKSDEVQTNATQYPYYIVLANSYKTEVQVDIDKVVSDINNLSNEVSKVDEKLDKVLDITYLLHVDINGKTQTYTLPQKYTDFDYIYIRVYFLQNQLVPLIFPSNRWSDFSAGNNRLRMSTENYAVGLYLPTETTFRVDGNNSATWLTVCGLKGKE